MSDSVRAKEWRVVQSGNRNKAWIVCADKKISPLMTLVAARQLAKLHNTELHFEVLAAYKEQAALSQPSGENWDTDDFVPVGEPRLSEIKNTLKSAAQNYLSQPSVQPVEVTKSPWKEGPNDKTSLRWVVWDTETKEIKYVGCEPSSDDIAALS